MPNLAIVYLILLAVLLVGALWRKEAVYAAVAIVATLLILVLAGIRI